MSAVTELEQGARTVAERAGPAVVRIGRDARGSGVVVAPGQVLTNAHNLRDRTTSVTFADGRSVQGAVAGVDGDGDLAVIEVDTAGVTPVDWGGPGRSRPARSSTPRARGHAGLRVTFGLVTGTEQSFRGPRGRRIRGSIEHTAPLARGSSGGPVLDGEGRLLALNTRRLGDGFYQAIPADPDLRARVEALAAGTSPVPSAPRRGGGPPGGGPPAAPGRRPRRPRRPAPAQRPPGRAGRRGPACARATCWSRPAVGPWPTPTTSTTCSTASPTTGRSTSRVVRGSEELAVTVTFADPPQTEPETPA